MIPPTIERLVAAAVLAPSSHNTQPWLFRAAADRVDLIADRLRALPVNDPYDRELTVSCGCALLNLRVQAAATGLAATVSTVPDPDDPDRLARVTLATTATSDPDASLAAAITMRHTHRAPFEGGDLPPDVTADLLRAARHEGAYLTVVDAAARRHALADLVAQADALLWDDVRWRRELAAWMHPRRTRDGLTMPTLAVPIAQAIVRSFDLGHGTAAKDRQLADASPMLAVLSTDGDSAADWLRAGQALQRVLLTAARAGVQASYLNAPVQVQALRPRVGEVAHAPGVVQLVLRLGRTAQVRGPGPRRAVADVLLPAPSEARP